VLRNNPALSRVDGAKSPFYASSRIRGWGAISLKDIDNYQLVHVENALQRLDEALVRLETAATRVAPAGEATRLAAELKQLTHSHKDLKQAATRVAAGLDAAIGRVQAALED
jgi:hypothetical protein